jgi:hypothetical protein
MQFRARFFGVLAILALGWMILGYALSTSAYSDVTSTPVAGSTSLSASDAQAARNVGAAIGSGLGLTVFLCTGFPLFLIFGLLSWRNSAGLRAQQRHEETVAAMRNAPR